MKDDKNRRAAIIKETVTYVPIYLMREICANHYLP
jgi:hypothetical protein